MISAITLTQNLLRMTGISQGTASRNAPNAINIMRAMTCGRHHLVNPLNRPCGLTSKTALINTREEMRATVGSAKL